MRYLKGQWFEKIDSASHPSVQEHISPGIRERYKRKLTAPVARAVKEPLVFAIENQASKELGYSLDDLTN